jgi:hypothetical protein
MDLWVAETPIHDDCEGALAHEAAIKIAASVLHEKLQHAPSCEQLTKSADRSRVEINYALVTADERTKTMIT